MDVASDAAAATALLSPAPAGAGAGNVAGPKCVVAIVDEDGGSRGDAGHAGLVAALRAAAGGGELAVVGVGALPAVGAH